MEWFELELTDNQIKQIQHIINSVKSNVENEYKCCVVCQLEIPTKENILKKPKLEGITLSQQNAIEAKKGFEVLARAEEAFQTHE